MLLFVSSLKLVVEIALLAFAGRWAVGLLAGAGREQNVFYKLLEVVSAPFAKLVEQIAPRALPARHRPLLAFLLLCACWVAVTAVKIDLCLRAGILACR